ncbi:type II secretion system protein [Pontibacterium granulatum]|uniref:type II secretion system protein n=1 Tax=Pontibacterium granulatum TaxID=2036029 RepID=UPI002499CD49|nr:type II secretion system protein [Pontibacterium granulatum]MDI3325070.1 type II secretion system protein [Pontibacterium granulatum]
MKKQAGFTIVELVVVIALLGILAAVALPRFLNVTDDAHAASVNGTGGALRSAAGLVKAQAVVDETAAGGTVNYDGTNVTVNNNMYPAATDAASCVTVWQNVLQNGAPSVATAAGSDYIVTWSADDSNCVYTYNAAANHTITYTPASGAVDISTP